MKATVVLLALLLASAMPLYAAIDMGDLVLYLPLDEGSGNVAKDLSGNGNDGELMGDVDWVDGKIRKGVHISDSDAGNMISVADSDSLDVTGPMTIAMWVQLESLTGSCAIITKADTYMIHSSDWSGNGIEQELLLWPFDNWQTAASTPIQFSEWKHVVGVYDGSEVRMYIDGELKGQRARTGDTAVTTNDLVIGRDNRSCCSARVFGVTVDDVMMFSRALSAAEIGEVMSGITAVQPDGLLTTTWGSLRSSF